MIPFLTLHLHDFADIGAIVAGFATLILVGAAIWAGLTAERSIDEAAAGVRSQIAEQGLFERRRRAYDHLGVFNSHDFTAMSAKASGVFLRCKGGADVGDILASLDEAEMVRVQTVLNYYEQVATEYNAGFLDTEAAEPLLFVAVVMWQQARELTEWHRRDDSRYFEQWKALYVANSALAKPLKPGPA
jgi:hypothetical protein